MIRWPLFGVRRKAQTLGFPTHIELLPYLVWLSSFWQKLEPIGNRAFSLENGLAASKFLISRPLRPENISERSVDLDSVCVGKPRPWTFPRTNDFERYRECHLENLKEFFEKLLKKRFERLMLWRGNILKAFWRDVWKAFWMNVETF